MINDDDTWVILGRSGISCPCVIPRHPCRETDVGSHQSLILQNCNLLGNIGILLHYSFWPPVVKLWSHVSLMPDMTSRPPPAPAPATSARVTVRLSRAQCLKIFLAFLAFNYFSTSHFSFDNFWITFFTFFHWLTLLRFTDLKAVVCSLSPSASIFSPLRPVTGCCYEL